MLRTLVITSCTGEKFVKSENQLTQEDFRDPSRLHNREKELHHSLKEAGKMYAGLQHRCLMRGIYMLRSSFKDVVFDVGIVSAGYGLVSEEKMIAPYEVTFNNMKNSEIIPWSRFLNIHNDLEELIKGYDLVFFLLGEKYLRAIELPFKNIDLSKRLIFLASKNFKPPAMEPYSFFEVGKREAIAYGYGLVGLKGYLFKLISEEIVANGIVLIERIKEEPEVLLAVLEKYKKIRYM